MVSEREKMIHGELYDADDPELVRDRLNARKLTRLFNNTLETDVDQRKKIIKNPRAVYALGFNI